ncbi:MAG: ribonuclease P protein component [Prevotella sp.]|jgi:ribonuclease P protein component|nr:ribonuclease P protein component [Prevotella sp.]
MDNTKRNTLGKTERICGTKRLEQLFASGISFIAYPLRVVYIQREKGETEVSILVSVSKKKFRRAVKRNRVKRLIRESYRLNKAAFWNICQQYDTGLDVAFLFLKDELPDCKEIENAMLKAAVTLDDKLKGNASYE